MAFCHLDKKLFSLRYWWIHMRQKTFPFPKIKLLWEIEVHRSVVCSGKIDNTRSEWTHEGQYGLHLFTVSQKQNWKRFLLRIRFWALQEKCSPKLLSAELKLLSRVERNSCWTKWRLFSTGNRFVMRCFKSIKLEGDCEADVDLQMAA